MLKQLSKKYLGSTIPVINLHGVIDGDCTDRVANRLSAISKSRAIALAVSINSHGGSVVQSDIISKKIRDFASQKNLKIYTFAKDIAASSGYFILSCGDEVYADRTSIVGSIGVILYKYRLQGLLEMTSAEVKQLQSTNNSLQKSLDAFSQPTPQERQMLKNISGSTHDKFISIIKKNRGDRLKVNDEMFNGAIYNGKQAEEIGLVDGVGSMVDVLEAKHPGCRLQIEEQKSLLNCIRAFM